MKQLMNQSWQAMAGDDGDAVGLDGGGLCKCGCGEPASDGVELHAILLAVARKSLDKLQAKAKSGGERERRAEDLMWAWNRCERGFEAYVHGEQLWECGPPTPLWVNSWRRRVEEL